MSLGDLGEFLMNEPMTYDEIHEFGIQIVFEQLTKEGYEILSDLV